MQKHPTHCTKTQQMHVFKWNRRNQPNIQSAQWGRSTWFVMLFLFLTSKTKSVRFFAFVSGNTINCNAVLLTLLTSMISVVTFSAFNEGASRGITNKLFYRNMEVMSMKCDTCVFDWKRSNRYYNKILPHAHAWRIKCQWFHCALVVDKRSVPRRELLKWSMNHFERPFWLYWAVVPSQ